MSPSSFCFSILKLNLIYCIISSLNSKRDLIFYLWLDLETSIMILSLVVGDKVFKTGCFGKYTNCFFSLEVETIYILTIWFLKMTRSSFRFIASAPLLISCRYTYFYSLNLSEPGFSYNFSITIITFIASYIFGCTFLYAWSSFYKYWLSTYSFVS